MTVRWEDEKLDGECFSWVTEWRAAPTHKIAGIMELYEQQLLLTIKLYRLVLDEIDTSIFPHTVVRFR